MTWCHGCLAIMKADGMVRYYSDGVEGLHGLQS